MRTLERAFRHFHAMHRVVREIVPAHSSSHDLTHQVPKVAGCLPGITALQLGNQELLNLGTPDVAQSAITEAWKQMLSQKERINLLRRILECWKNVRLELFGHKVPKSHCGFRS